MRHSVIALTAVSAFALTTRTALASSPMEYDPGANDQAMLDRSLVLDAGQAEVIPRLGHMRFDMGPFGTASATTLLVGGSFGVMPGFEAGLETGVTLDPDMGWSESATLRGMFLVHDTDQLDVAAQAVLPLNFSDGADILGFALLGAPARFALNPTMALFFGHGAIAFGMGDNTWASLALNAGFGIQISPVLSARIDTQLASIAILGDSNGTTHLGDFIPLTLSGLFSIAPGMDAHLNISFPDLGSAGDFMTFTAGGSFQL